MGLHTKVPTAARLVLLGEVCASIAMIVRSLASGVIYERFFGREYSRIRHYESGGVRKSPLIHRDVCPVQLNSRHIAYQKIKLLNRDFEIDYVVARELYSTYCS